jgi:hypothetical protein
MDYLDFNMNFFEGTAVAPGVGTAIGIAAGYASGADCYKRLCGGV